MAILWSRSFVLQVERVVRVRRDLGKENEVWEVMEGLALVDNVTPRIGE